MKVHVKGMVFLDHVTESRRDALRETSWHTASDPDQFEVRNGPQSLEDALEKMVGQQERVAAGQDDVPHLRVSQEIVHDAVQLSFFQEPGLSHQPLACAETAVDRALVGNHEQDPVRIPMDEMRYGTVHVLMQRIFCRALVGDLVGFRNDLSPERITPLLDEFHPHGGDAHRIFRDDILNLIRIHIEVLGQFFGLDHALSQGLLPGLHAIRLPEGCVRLFDSHTDLTKLLRFSDGMFQDRSKCLESP